MITFRTRQETTTSVVILLAVVGLAAVLGFMLYAKARPPKPEMTKNTLQKEMLKVELAQKDAEKKRAMAKAGIDQWLWTGTTEEIGASALARATQLTKAHHVTLASFRPQKTADAGGLTQLPFTMTVGGKFPDVAALVKDLETPSERICVNLVQLNAGEGNGDDVTATIGEIAFIATPTPPKASAKNPVGTTTKPSAAPTIQP